MKLKFILQVILVVFFIRCKSAADKGDSVVEKPSKHYSVVIGDSTFQIDSEHFVRRIKLTWDSAYYSGNRVWLAGMPPSVLLDNGKNRCFIAFTANDGRINIFKTDVNDPGKTFLIDSLVVHKSFPVYPAPKKTHSVK